MTRQKLPATGVAELHTSAGAHHMCGLKLFICSGEPTGDRCALVSAMNVRIFAITRQGLVALALSVAALWTCVGMEAATRHRAERDTVASIRTLAHLRRLTTNPNVSKPAREPMPASTVARPYSS